MILQSLVGAFVVVGVLLSLVALTINRKALKDPSYYEITILLGSGGHTGEMCELVRGFQFNKTSKINIIIASSDRSSQGFFINSLRQFLSQDEFRKAMDKVSIYYIARTNQVKQSYATALISTLKATVNALRLIVKEIGSTTHFVANGPGTCVPLFYIFFVLRKLKLSRVKLIFLESWCRVKDLSLSGKLVKPIADQFIVHWPELAAKYKACKYYGKII